jgi:hypothetical protein
MSDRHLGLGNPWYISSLSFHTVSYRGDSVDNYLLYLNALIKYKKKSSLNLEDVESYVSYFIMI